MTDLTLVNDDFAGHYGDIVALTRAFCREFGRYIVEFEQERTVRSRQMPQRLSSDLRGCLGHNFAVDDFKQIRLFYQASPSLRFYEALSQVLGKALTP